MFRATLSCLTACCIVFAIAACSPNTNRTIGSLQFNAETEPYPANYAAIATRYIQGRQGADDASLFISAPRAMTGLSAFDARRWYTCVVGLEPARVPATRAEPLVDKIENLLTDVQDERQYQIIVVMRDGYSPYIIEAFGSRLCRGGDYEPLRMAKR